ncbi:MAG: hypothetical protein JZU53_04230 [Paludibacter sp.]|nr:hypothetical protein [Paludibacter sp.]
MQRRRFAELNAANLRRTEDSTPTLCQDAFALCQDTVALSQNVVATSHKAVDFFQRAHAFSQRAAAFFPDVKETVQTHKILESEGFESCQRALELCQNAFDNCQNAYEFLFLYTKIKSYRRVIKLWRTYFLSCSIGGWFFPI